MEDSQVLKYIQESIKSGQYFADARSWYYKKYLNPISHYSIMLLSCIVFFVLSLGILINVSTIFPLVNQVRYSLNLPNALDTQAKIIKADYIESDPIKSIADIMVRNYVEQREGYNYFNLKKQFTFIKNLSTRNVYKKFYAEMDINNIDSIILKYKTDIRRSVTKILSSSSTGVNQLTLVFTTKATNIAGEIIEDKKFSAVVDFDIGAIDLEAANGSKFNFTITGYKLNEIRD